MRQPSGGRPRAAMTPTEPATVSVVVPCFNYGAYLPEAVGSVLDQPGVAVQVIIVDDASADDSLEVARALAAADPRVTVIAHRTNAGPVATFNDGLQHASGEFLVRLDADDLLTPGSLSRSVQVCRAHPGVGLVYGRPLHFTERLPRPRQRARGWTIWDGTDWLADRCADAQNVITSPEAFMRMSVVREVGGQRPLAHTHDMEMWLRIAAFADVAYIRGADQAWHRDHPQSLSAREVDRVRDLAERRDAFRELAAGVAGTQPGVPELVGEALRALARQAVGAAMVELEHGGARAERVPDYLEIARDADPAITGTAEWAALQRRLVGPRPAAGTVLLRSIGRRIDWRRRRRTWQRRGVWS